MIEDFPGLLLAFADLAPGQFLLLVLGLAASVFAGFPALLRPKIMGFDSR